MKRLSLFLCCQLAWMLTAAEPVGSEPKAAVTDDPQTEANISRSVARVLERYHYLQLKFDDALSEKFLNRYIETLDPQHLYFLQSDIEEFSVYKHQLDDLTLRAGDTSPAHVIFGRFMQRLDQQVAFVQERLKNEKFTFKGKDRFPISRKDAPHPKDLAEARELWHQRLRFDYLQEKLSRRHKEEKEANHKPGSKEKVEKPKKPVLDEHTEIVTKLTNRYNRLQKTFKDLSKDDVLELYLTALAHVYDPHSDYMGRAQMENFAISMKLSLFGIGAVLSTDDEGYCKIMELKDGPAMRSKKIKQGDRIVAVAQDGKEPVDCVGMKLNKVVEMIRGPKNTKVELTILPADATDPSLRKVVTLVRDEIKLEDQEAKAKVIDMPGDDGKPVRIGVLDLPSFYEDMEGRHADHKSTSADMARLLKKLNEEKVSGIILDLRRNGGGALTEAIRLTGLFIKKGPVVQTKNPDGHISVRSDNDSSLLFDGPMIVLTSRFSASASEILAGALQDYGRALIVGDKSTHGKGTVQQLLQMDEVLRDSKLDYAYNPGALKFTIQKFYRAGGSSTQLKGVIPDLVLPSVNNYAEVGEESLDNPMPWDEISSAKFEKLNRVEPYLAELKKRSDQRIGSDKDFSYIREDIARFRKSLADKTVSLNEAERIKEMDELTATSEARKKDRLARKASDQKVYEVTLRNVDQPGLSLASKKEKDEAALEATATSPSADLTAPADEEEKTPASDATLDETKRILADYIFLVGRDNPAVAATK